MILKQPQETGFFSFFNGPLFYFFFQYFVCSFIHWLCWVFLAACQLSLNVASKGYSLVAAKGLLIAAVSVIAGHGLEV